MEIRQVIGIIGNVFKVASLSFVLFCTGCTDDVVAPDVDQGDYARVQETASKECPICYTEDALRSSTVVQCNKCYACICRECYNNIMRLL